MRPFSPLPLTLPRSTPSSRANLRTEGDACALPKLVSSIPGSEPRVRDCVASFGPCATARRAGGDDAADLSAGAAAGSTQTPAPAAAAKPFTGTPRAPRPPLPPPGTGTFSPQPPAGGGPTIV